MVVVKIELWPVGDESKARCLGKAEIALTGLSDDKQFGNYKFNLLKMDVPLSGGMKHLKKDIWKQGRAVRP